MDQPMSYMETIERVAKVIATMPIGERVPLPLMATPPVNPIERAVIGDELWGAFLTQFEASLSERDRVLLHNAAERIAESPEHLRVMHTFDDFLLSMFAKFGWRLLMSYGAIQRISEWEKHSPVLLERLGKELAQFSRVSSGEGSTPLPGDMDVFADAAIPELERLFRLKWEKLGRTGVSCEKISEWMHKEIAGRPEEFPALRPELLMLEGFVRNLPTRKRDFAQAFERGDIRAPGFFYTWVALVYGGRSRKDVQNQIGKQRNQRRRAVQG
jgi:hypothetical protein